MSPDKMAKIKSVFSWESRRLHFPPLQEHHRTTQRPVFVPDPTPGQRSGNALRSLQLPGGPGTRSEELGPGGLEGMVCLFSFFFGRNPR